MTPKLTDTVASVQMDKYLKRVLTRGKTITVSFKHLSIYTFNSSQLPPSVTMTWLKLESWRECWQDCFANTASQLEACRTTFHKNVNWILHRYSTCLWNNYSLGRCHQNNLHSLSAIYIYISASSLDLICYSQSLCKKKSYLCIWLIKKKTLFWNTSTY